MDLKDLNCFVSIAEAHGFRRAAEHLGIEQSALSRRIRNMEERLGTSLFERHRGGVRLTVAGQHFLDDVRIVLSQLDGALRAVKAAGRGGNGTLNVGVVASISSGYFNELLREYCSAHPAVRVRVFEGDHRTHIAAVVGRRLDLTVLTGLVQPPANCDVEGLWEEPKLVALQSDHQRAGADVLTWTDISDEFFIVSQEVPGPEIHDFIVQRLARIGFSPSIEQQHVGREGLMALVGLGFGLTLTSGAEAGIAYPNVRYVPLKGETLPFSAVWSPENDNPALRRFLSLARVLARRSRRDAP